MWTQQGPQLGEHLPKIWGEDTSGASVASEPQMLIASDNFLQLQSRLLGSDASSWTHGFKGP